LCDVGHVASTDCFKLEDFKVCIAGFYYIYISLLTCGLELKIGNTGIAGMPLQMF